MKIRLASELQKDSIVDGDGLRTVIWTQGCPHNCEGCHNPNTHSYTGGFLKDIKDIKCELSALVGQAGITLSGGEPFMQPKECLEIIKYAKELQLNIWCFTGFTFEQLLELSKNKPIYLELLQNIDVLIDGRFELSKRSLNLKYRGSKNQRIINVKKSLKENRVCLIRKYQKETNGQKLYKPDKYMFT